MVRVNHKKEIIKYLYPFEQNFFKQPNISVMKPNRLELKMKVWPVFCLLIALQLLAIESHAQLPDCSSGTVMYAIFNDSIGSTSAINPQSEIRAVNYATGAVGPLMGGTKYLISKTISGTTYYGSAGLGVDFITNRFYTMTQMAAPGGRKDIITINTLTAITTVIGTTPSSLNKYHFVKVAVSPSGVGYAIGVTSDTTAGVPADANPLIRFTTCGGAPSVGCSTIELLGYLAAGPLTTNWDLFNGDIAFDNAGNMYFFTASFGRVNAANRYKDARLFRIQNSNIPAVAGTGSIPLSLMAEYNALDSTVINGIALDPAGTMYVSTRRYSGIQNAPLPPFVNQLYSSSTPGTAILKPGFGPISTGYSIADLASCYFPLIVLDGNNIVLSGKYNNGANRLTWVVNNNDKGIQKYEVQRSDDFSRNYSTIGTVDPVNTDQANQTYTFNDPNQEFGSKKFYRIREVHNDGRSFYSKVLQVNNTEVIHFINKPKPNPFINEINVAVELLKANPIQLSITDASGRLTFQKNYIGTKGVNNLMLNNLDNLKPGIYFLEISSGSETIHEKIVKR